MTTMDAAIDEPLPPLINPTDLFEVWKEEALLLADCRLTGKTIGPVTGISEIDKILTTGFRPGVHTLQGNSAAGKTAMALQIAANCRTPCLYVTCEMAPLVLLQRIGANLSGKPFYKMVDGSLMMDESLEAAELAVKKTAGHLGILDGRLQAITAKAISAQAYSVKSLMPDCPHLLVIIDSFNAWTANVFDGREYEAANLGVKSIQTLAASLNCAVLVICEKPKGSNDQNSEDMITGAADTRRVGYSSDTVINMRVEPDAKFDDRTGTKEVQLCIAKHRNGQGKKTLTLDFHGNFQRFTVRLGY